MGLAEGGKWKIDPIGVIRSCYVEKFGIPRQPGMVDKARAHLELLRPYNREEMVKELAQFSHLWIVFLFHKTVDEGWKPTVRPPGLGGQKRVGVFASRSPHRPNHIGISAVKLVGIIQEKSRVTLELGGGDFLDNTPVVDIKPYIPYSDSIEEAKGGYSGVINSNLEIRFSSEADSFCSSYRKKTGKDLKGLISQILVQDPRPASQRGRKKDFGIRLWDINIRWCANDDVFVVTECREEDQKAS
jgi:tRNA-Thr(GGU) m(6)t(6)A37 methyltransferase TsaA